VLQEQQTITKTFAAAANHHQNHCWSSKPSPKPLSEQQTITKTIAEQQHLHRSKQQSIKITCSTNTKNHCCTKKPANRTQAEATPQHSTVSPPKNHLIATIAHHNRPPKPGLKTNVKV
jgi:hypothetical protein